MQATVGTAAIQLVFELRGTRDTDLACRAFEVIHAKNQVPRTRFLQMHSEVLQVALKECNRYQRTHGKRLDSADEI